MPRSKPPRTRFTPKEKGLLRAAARATNSAKAQEVLKGWLTTFTSCPDVTYPRAD